MKRMICLMMVLLYLICLGLSGCRSADLGKLSAGNTTASTAAPSASTSEVTGGPEQTTEVMGEATVEVTQLEDPPATLPLKDPSEPPAGTALAFSNVGSLRVTYAGNTSWVKYVTDLSQLPEAEGLDQFDEAYFEDHALVLVMETVGSGSVKVGIDRIMVDESTAVVTLSHEMKGDVGTADMATWLLWAEVETDLDYQWSIANPAVTSGAVTR